MLLEIPAKVRSFLYTISVIGMPIVAYLAEQEVISTFVAGLFVVVNSGILLLARINVTPEE